MRTPRFVERCLIFTISSAMLKRTGQPGRRGESPLKPSVVLGLHRVAIREAAGRFRSANPRVFGSVAHGADEDVVWDTTQTALPDLCCDRSVFVDEPLIQDPADCGQGSVSDTTDRHPRP